MHIHYLFQLILYLILVVSSSRTARYLILHAIQLLLESSIPASLFCLPIIWRLRIWLRCIPWDFKPLYCSCADWLIQKLASTRTRRLIDYVSWVLEYASLCLWWLASRELASEITTSQLADRWFVELLYSGGSLDGLISGDRCWCLFLLYSVSTLRLRLIWSSFWLRFWCVEAAEQL